jgi:hypothetical protein
MKEEWAVTRPLDMRLVNKDKIIGLFGLTNSKHWTFCVLQGNLNHARCFQT